MATVANIEAETNSIIENHDQPPPLNENIIQAKTPEINIELNDSRLTDPDGAQSPASSTYADCEENDISVSENQPEIQIKQTHSDITDNEATSTNDDISTDKNENLNEPDDTVTDNNDLVDKCKINDNNESEETNVLLITQHNESVEIKEEKSPEKSLPEEIIQRAVSDEKFQEISENEADYVDEEYLDDEHYEENELSGLEDECSEEESDQHELDRENGDGQEGNEDEDAAAQKELDDDEDRRNPQYIPKRGFFYEHDDRTNTSEDETSEAAKKEAEVETETAKGKKGRLFADGKWQHDLYREDEQKPKSAQELIDIYGYDIRNEEAAPKARRRRKYGRGPNKYTRKWDDEGAYAKQMSAKPFRGRNKTSFKKEDYDDEFPAMSEKKSPPDYRSRERPPPPPPAKKTYHNEPPPPRNDDYKYKDEYRTSNQKSNPNYQDRSRNFSKRIPSAKEPRRSLNSENYESPEYIKHVPKTIRNSQFTPPSNDNVVRGRGRGIGHGKNVRAPSSYEEGARLQFTAANRGRAKRLPKQTQHYYASKHVPDEDIQALTDQMSATDLSSRKINLLDRQYGEPENLLLNEQSDAQLNSLNAVSRSKRYSHQRQRLLPDGNKNATATLNMHQNMQITHSVQNVQNVASGLCQSMAPTHTSMPLMTQNQCTPTPQTVATPLSVTPASISSSSLAVSASLIPLSAPPLTASGAALSAGAPPLPIMGFFQHPQAGFTNQATPAQLYTREQTVMGAPSNQPVQLVAFLPASPILSNTNHSQSAPPPPPPPPPPGFPTTVMSYQQTTQTPQNASTFNSETYTMPPVTLAPIHQPPEVYQSRGGVTYYNTRSQFKPRSPPPPRVKTAIPIVPPPSSETLK